MIHRQVLKRKAVSRRVLELSCTQTNRQTHKQEDNEFFLRRSTGLANRSANKLQAIARSAATTLIYELEWSFFFLHRKTSGYVILASGLT